MRTLPDSDIEVLHQWIDDYGLDGVVSTLAEIARERARHCSDVGQSAAAQHNEDAARALARVAYDIEQT